MRDWALAVLRCPACGAALEPELGGVRCRRCGAAYTTRDDVLDFLGDLHAVPARERAAVAAGDELHWRPDAAAAPETAAAEAGYRAAVAEARALLEEVLARAPLPEGALVVELGADFCWASELLVERGARVLATDISDHLRHARAGAAAHLCRLQADMNRLPVADGAADAVWANACVHHSWDLERTFAEIARVLRPGGVAYLCNEPLPAGLRYLFGFGFGRAERARGIHETWLPRRVWLATCRRHGLAPRLLFPDLDGERLARRFARRRLPALLGRGLAPLLKPLLPALQVSIHLLAEKRS